MQSPAQDTEKAALLQAIAERDSRIKELELLVDFLKKKPYRPSSESLSGMTSLFNESEAEADKAEKTEAEPKTSVGSHERKKPTRSPLPESIPRTVVRHELPEGERSCTCCGGALHEMGVEASEQLDIVPQTVRVIRHERVVYGCRGCEAAPKTVAMPLQPIPKSMASASTLSHVAVSKYCDHLPLYRQEAMWKRLGVDFDRTTLASWMVKIGTLIQPLVNLLHEDILSGSVVHCDETTVQVLHEQNKKATSLGYMWVLSRAGPGPKAHIFEYDPSRSGRVARRLLSDFKGTVVTDGLDGYRQMEERGIRRAGCWAHVRRKFKEALDIDGKGSSAKTVAGEMLEMIGRLYQIERELASLAPEARLAERLKRSSKVLGDIEAVLSAKRNVVPPKSPTGRALSYLAGQWPALLVFCEDGSVPIDNNGVENVIRPFALGRKNWLFSASAAGARASANLYSLLQTARDNGLDPHAYLTRVLKELPKTTTAEDIAVLLPYPSTH